MIARRLRRLLSTTNNKRTIDLRSDTVTRPTPAMINAMLTASGGDEVYNEDETTHMLQQKIANITGHEDALFCCSGTMSNQLALRVWLERGLCSVLADARSHIHQYECGGVAFHSGASTTTVKPKNQRYLTCDEVEANIVHHDIHCAETRVVSLENTLNGVVFPLDEIAYHSNVILYLSSSARSISNMARGRGLKMHLDGARLWHAAVATNTPLKEWCRHFDSVSLCLSKGIGAPIGSVLVGRREFIERARRYRKLMGGGWRQSGILAAAALHALDETFPNQLSMTHELAQHLHRQLLTSLSNSETIYPVDTNMIFLDISKTKVNVPMLTERLIHYGIRIGGYDNAGTILRLVVHYQITRKDVDYVVQCINSIMD